MISSEIAAGVLPHQERRYPVHVIYPLLSYARLGRGVCVVALPRWESHSLTFSHYLQWDSVLSLDGTYSTLLSRRIWSQSGRR
jgi:hypothetical protein